MKGIILKGNQIRVQSRVASFRGKNMVHSDLHVGSESPLITLLGLLTYFRSIFPFYAH